MIRLLDDLFLLKEIDEVDLPYDSVYIRNKYPDKIVVMRHVAFIYKSVLDKEANEKLTDLSNYILVGEFASHICVHKSFLFRRIDFMKKTKIKLFNYMELCNNYYIELCDTNKRLFQEYQPFVIKFNEPIEIEHHITVGDIAIGFY
ncbi:MAG: hypothetical protein ACMV1K_13130 [Sulfurospirillum sp.]